jgi:hypothetical protein
LSALYPNHICSPYKGSTEDNGDEVSVCGGPNDDEAHLGGPDQGFSAVLQPGQRIRINQVDNNFETAHTLRYGGNYPGESEVICEKSEGDIAEREVATYTNEGAVAVKVYFVMDTRTKWDGYAIVPRSTGIFELEWLIDTPGMHSIV